MKQNQLKSKQLSMSSTSKCTSTSCTVVIVNGPDFGNLGNKNCCRVDVNGIKGL